MGRQLGDQFVVEAAALRSQHHQPARARPFRLHGTHTVKHWLTADQHSRTATERAVVNFLMLVLGVVPNIPQPHVDQSALDRQLQQALLPVAVEDAGKERKDVETHGGDTMSNDEARMTKEALNTKSESVFPPGLDHSDILSSFGPSCFSNLVLSWDYSAAVSAGASAAASVCFGGRAFGAAIGGGAAASPNRFVRTFLIRAATLTLGWAPTPSQ